MSYLWFKMATWKDSELSFSHRHGTCNYIQNNWLKDSYTWDKGEPTLEQVGEAKTPSHHKPHP